MRMTSRWIGAMAIGILFTGITCGAAGNTDAVAKCPHKAKGFGGGMGEFKQLNLTSNQSQQIEAIMELNRESMQTAMTQARETREALNRQIQSGPFDEQAVRAACKQNAAMEEEAAVLRAKVAGQIRAVLTSDQQAALDKLRADTRGKMHKRAIKNQGRPDKTTVCPDAP